MERLFAVAGAFFMFVGVGAGAFGAHGLSGYFERYPELKGTFETAVRYHLVHGLGMFAASGMMGKVEEMLPTWAGVAFASGILLFSGSLYLLVLTRHNWLGAVAPIGGLAFLVGWLCLGLAAWRG